MLGRLALVAAAGLLASTSAGCRSQAQRDADRGDRDRVDANSCDPKLCAAHSIDDDPTQSEQD